MKIETYIDALISYATMRELIRPEDHDVAVNKLLEILQLDDYTSPAIRTSRCGQPPFCNSPCGSTYPLFFTCGLGCCCKFDGPAGLRL